MAPKQCSYAALQGQYILQQTLGTGGFAKVKLATHVLTGEKVAIKIMDKASLGDDLPRVQLEIEALKALNHPHICKLYQVIETDKRFFLVLEYCPGGELFDYIIEKDRVTEKEARSFFRQIISAVSYIHKKGYAHRDLKPENLLLDHDQNLKLIDFGLCAKPKSGMQQQLETCCGSPAYAAPELITGDFYNGTKVDIWSLGVMLYALLCGFLPFDDENVNKLYRKIQKGRYFCPVWLTTESKSILADMLQVDPTKRISIEELKTHPWVTKGPELPNWSSEKQEVEYDPDCVAELAVYYKRPMKTIESSLNMNKFDYFSASYYLMLAKKKAGKEYSLLRRSNILKENNTDNGSGLFDSSPVSVRLSMDNLSNTELLVMGNLKDQSSLPKPLSNFSLHNVETDSEVDDKENFALPAIPSAKKKSSTTVISSVNHSLHSPKALGFTVSLDAAVDRVGGTPHPSTFGSEKRAKSFESPTAAMTPKRRPCRQVGSSSARKVLGSIEKGLDCVRNLLTPKKRGCGAHQPRQVKDLCNVSAMNDRVAPEEILESLQHALIRKGMLCKQKGFTLLGKLCEERRVLLRFELEVVRLPHHRGAVGVRRKRLQGDAWHYKRVCEEVLRLALLDAATTDV